MIDWSTYREEKLRVVTEYDDTYDNASWDMIDAACLKNDAAALYEKGIRLYLGEGVEKDEKAALFWFEKLLDRQKHTRAMFRMGEYWQYHGADIQEQKKCLPYYAYASELGDGESSRRLGVFYASGELIAKNIEQAFRYYRLALRQGENYAKVSLGILYEDQHNYEKAIQLYRSATQDGYEWAYYFLGRLYFEGRGVEKNEEKSLSCFLKAFEKGLDEAKPFLGFLYGLSDLPEKDQEKALNYLEDVLDDQKSFAYRWKGVILYYLKRRDEAVYWLEQAVEQGDSRAKDYLKKIKEEDAKPSPEEICKGVEYYIIKETNLLNAYEIALHGVDLYPDNLDVKYSYAKILDVYGQILMTEDKKPDYQARMDKCREAWDILQDLQSKHYSPVGMDNFIAEVAWHYGSSAFSSNNVELSLKMLQYADLHKHPSGYILITINHHSDKSRYGSWFPDDINNLKQAVENENWENNVSRSIGYHILCQSFLNGEAGVVDVPYAYYCIQRAVELAPENEEYRIILHRFSKNIFGNITFH